MEFRDCFIGKPDLLQWGLACAIVDKVIAEMNEGNVQYSKFNISMWQHYLIKAIFSLPRDNIGQINKNKR